MLTLIRDFICLVQKHCDMFDRDQDEYVQELRERYRESEVATQRIEGRRVQPNVIEREFAPKREVVDRG